MGIDHNQLTADQLHSDKAAYPNEGQLIVGGQAEAWYVYDSNGYWFKIDTSGATPILNFGGGTSAPARIFRFRDTNPVFIEGRLYMKSATAPSSETDHSHLYAADDAGGVSQMFAVAEDGTTTQLTRSNLGGEAALNTTDDTETTLWSISGLGTDKGGWIEAVVAARENGAQNTNLYRKMAKWDTNGSSVVTVGTVVDVITEDEDVAGWACTIDASGTALRVRVTGAIGDAVDWTGLVSYQIAP